MTENTYDAFQKQNSSHKRKGGIQHYFSIQDIQFSCGPGSSRKVSGRTPEEKSFVNYYSLMKFFLSRMLCSRIPEAPGSYPEGSRKQTYGTMKWKHQKISRLTIGTEGDQP